MNKPLLTVFLALSACATLLYLHYRTSQRSRVILIGIDGLNPEFIPSNLHNSVFKHLQSRGSHTLSAKTVIEAWSAPGWTSIACSLLSTDTGIRNNSWIPPWAYKTNHGISQF